MGKYLVPEMAQPDVVLEVVILVGQLLTDGSAAALVAASPIPRALFSLWLDKADADAELKLQLLFTFFRLLGHQATREELLYGTRAAAEIIGCVDSPHPAVRATANVCLDIIVECDRAAPGDKAAGAGGGESKGGEPGGGGGLGRLGTEVCRRRFQAHNREWLAALREEEAAMGGFGGGGGGGRGGYEGGGGVAGAYGFGAGGFGGGFESPSNGSSSDGRDQSDSYDYGGSPVNGAVAAYHGGGGGGGGDYGGYGGGGGGYGGGEGKFGEEPSSPRSPVGLGGWRPQESQAAAYAGEGKGGESKGGW